MKFEEMKPGLFRHRGIVYCKFTEPLNEYNAVMIVDGTLMKFTDGMEVDEY